MAHTKINNHALESWHRKYHILFVKIVKALGLKPNEYDISHFRAGMGISGEAILQTNTFRVIVPIHMNPTDDETRHFSYQGCNGLYDYRGTTRKYWLMVKELHKPDTMLRIFRGLMSGAHRE